MSDFTNFVDNLLAPSQRKSQTAQQSYRPPVQQKAVQQPQRSFLDKALDFISPYIAPIQRAVQNPVGTAQSAFKQVQSNVSKPFGVSLGSSNKLTHNEALSLLKKNSTPQKAAKSSINLGVNLLGVTSLSGVGGKTVAQTVTAPSVISFVKNGQKVFTRVSPEELSVLRNETKNIPAITPDFVKRGISQLHLDAITPNLTNRGVEVSRKEFLKLHPQAGEVFNRGKAAVSQFIKGSDGKFLGSTKAQKVYQTVESKIGLQSRPVTSSLDNTLPIANKQSAGVAVLESMSGNPKKTGFAALPKNLQNSFQDLVNGRSASNVVQKKVAQQFRALDRNGVQDLIDFSKGVDRPGFKQARDYLDNIHTYLRQQGFDVNYKENYLTGAYQESAQEVEKVFRKLGLNPSFTKESLFKNYEEAIAAGLTPRFNKLSDLIGYYSGRVNNAVANKTIWKQLTEQGLIRSKPEVGWTRLDPGAFPGQGFKFVNEAGEIVTHSGSSYAPDDLAQALNNYFKRPEGNLEKVANFSSTVKNIILSSGIPKTGINFHGFTTLFRTGFSPKAAGYLLKPSAADNFIKGNLNKLEFFVRKGLKATTEEHAFQDAFRGVAGKSLFSKSLNKVIKVHQVLFEDPLFQKVLPALKLQKAESIYKNLLKSGMGADDAAREAAKQANSFFGGINWEQMGRSRDFQNILRSVFLAPDLLESQLQLGKGIGKGLLNPRDPRGKAYRDFMRTFILSYIALNLANKETTGKWAFENPTGHAFELKVGDTYIRPYASGADFIRLPVDFANALVQKDIDSAWDVVRNRISSPAQAATQIASATDRFGNPLFNNKYTGKPLPIQQQLAGVAGIGGNLGIPSYAQAGINVASGRSTLGKGVVQGLELPVRFAPKNKKSTSKTRKRGYSRR